MNPSISSQLFHFTGVNKERGFFKPDVEAFATLKKILNSKYLLLSPNRIQLLFPQDSILMEKIELIIQMACLTETPIEFLTDHIKLFGKFGLGFTIDWALRNGGQNVIYCDSHSPNSFAHTVSEIGNYFAMNGMAHDIRFIRWVSELAAITENFEYRNEREWRFLRASNIDDQLAIPFQGDDLKTVICPRNFIMGVEEIMRINNLHANLFPTDKYL
jgi:hypothetical protein